MRTSKIVALGSPEIERWVTDYIPQEDPTVFPRGIQNVSCLAEGRGPRAWFTVHIIFTPSSQTFSWPRGLDLCDENNGWIARCCCSHIVESWLQCSSWSVVTGQAPITLEQKIIYEGKTNKNRDNAHNNWNKSYTSDENKTVRSVYMLHVPRYIPHAKRVAAETETEETAARIYQ